MSRFPKKLQEKLAHREERRMLRRLPEANDLVDFSSNDYLGFSKNRDISERASELLHETGASPNGATGSRLLSGNHPLYSELETRLSGFHRTEAALVFNSGYDANVGFFGCVPQRGDVVFYDEYVHASIRDGIAMGHAKSYKFRHNDLGDLKKKAGALRSPRASSSGGTGSAPRFMTSTGTGSLPKSMPSGESDTEGEVYVVTESVFSMDGDSPDLTRLAAFCEENACRLIVDEAHAVGVFGRRGEGLVQELGLQDAVFARTVTFGKALGCHGAAILGSRSLKNYLVNFARSLIYTTALPPHSVATILSAYELLSASGKNATGPQGHPEISILFQKIALFNATLAQLDLTTERHPPEEARSRSPYFIPSTSAIHSCIILGNERVRRVSERLREHGFDVRPILSPTVPEGQERLRICIHSFNTEKDIQRMLELLSNAIKKT